MDGPTPEISPETPCEDVPEGPIEATLAAPERGSIGRLFAFALGGTLLVLVPLLIVVAVVVRRDGAAPAAAVTSEAARPFDLPSLDGGRITQAAFSDRVVVVNVWASWCAPCREEAPVLERMAREPSAVAWYGIVRQDEPSAARAFARTHGLDYPHAVDNGVFALAHRVTVLPTTLIFAADGSFVGRIEGPVSENRLRSLIDDALAMGSE